MNSKEFDSLVIERKAKFIAQVADMDVAAADARNDEFSWTEVKALAVGGVHPSNARAAIPCMRWWCTPAVDLGPRICADCYNASAPGLIRCLSCAKRQAQRVARSAAHRADLYERRTQASINNDLALALRIDDTLECYHGMPGDNRVTCYRCQSWNDHAHHPQTGELMTLDQWSQYTADRPHIYAEGPS